MARFPLVPRASTIGGLALLLFLMVLLGGGLFYSYAARQWSPEAQRSLAAVLAAVLVVLAGLAWRLFLRGAPRE